MENIELPEHRFGMTGRNFNVPEVHDMPVWDVLESANELNRFRFESLTHKQRLFIDEYFATGFDATQAALKSGVARYEHEAQKAGADFIKKPYIKQAIKLALRYHFKKTQFQFDPNPLLKRLEAIALADPADYWDEEGNPIMPDDKAKRLAIKSIARIHKQIGTGKNATTIEEVKIELYSAVDAIKMLLQLFGTTPRLPPGNEDLVAAMIQGAQEEDNSVKGVVMFQINPIPSGQFVPAPEAPVRIIEHL